MFLPSFEKKGSFFLFLFFEKRYLRSNVTQDNSVGVCQRGTTYTLDVVKTVSVINLDHRTEFDVAEIQL